MILYKYLHPSKLSLLLQNQFLLTPAKYLNDALEAYVRVGPLSDEEIEKHFAAFEKDGPKFEGYDRMPVELRKQLFSMASQSKGFFENEPSEMRDALSRHLGIVSFTEDPTSQLMWGHYADAGKGFVVGLVAGEEKISRGLQAVPCCLGPAIKVNYSDQPQLLTPDCANAAHVLTLKRTAWAYEKEWRIIRGLEEAETIGEDSRPFYVLRIEPTHIRTITLGLEASKSDRDLIIQHFGGSTYPNTVVQEVVLNPHTLDFEIRAVTK